MHNFMPDNILPYKISTLIFFQDARGSLLLMRRRKQPNAGLWSPIGGKLEMGTGESPFEAACRETQEEIGLAITDKDLHLFAMIAEKNYENRAHWLMFLFDCRKVLRELPPPMEEGTFAFHRPEDLGTLDIPETDRQALWPLWLHKRHTFTALRADCHPDQPLAVVTEGAG
jgi:8-oxo-dGTP diphosphatase